MTEPRPPAEAHPAPTPPGPPTPPSSATPPGPPTPPGPRTLAEPAPAVRGVQYKGEPLDADRGPGLGCFRFQLVVLVVLIVLTPLSVAWSWPVAVSTGLLFAVIALLLVTGQTIIFLLRLVAADRRAGRRRPLGSPTRTVGELEDASSDESSQEPTDGSSDGGRVQQ